MRGSTIQATAATPRQERPLRVQERPLERAPQDGPAAVTRGAPRPVGDAVADQVSDRFLVAAAQEGDSHAFEALVSRHQDRAYRVALRMLGSTVDAEEAAQEALLQAWRGLPAFRAESAFSTWLYRIVINRCVNLRSARRPTEALPEVLVDRNGDPSETLERRERLRALARWLLQLSAEQRAALVLRELEGLSYDDIAEVLGVTVPAVKGRIHRARLALLEASATWP